MWLSHSWVQPQGPTLRSHPRVSSNGPGSWVPLQSLGPTFLVFLFWYVLHFDKKLIVLHHSDNTLLFYFDNCIKVKLSAIVLTMEKWLHLTWCLNKLCYKTNFFMIFDICIKLTLLEIILVASFHSSE